MWRTGMCTFGSRNWIFLFAALHLFTYAQGLEDILHFTIEPSDQVVLPGAGAVLGCAVAGPGRARLHWRYSADVTPHRDHALTRSDVTRKQLANGSLSIESMSASLAGQYQCVATVDQLGTIVSRTALVMLAELPTLLPGPRSILATEGAPALLACPYRAPVRAAARVEGAGPPDRRVYPAARLAHPPTLLLNVTWLRNGVPVRLEGARVALSGSGALELDPARSHDAATYHCRVGLSSVPHLYVDGEPIELRVSSEVSTAESAPRFIATPVSVTVIEGASVTFDCAAVGNPKPEMIWLNNGAAIDLSELDSRFYLVGSGSLRVQSARALDAGAYTCRAHSRTDSVDYTTHLHVVTVPRVHIPPPAILSAPSRGEVTLRCEARARPPPTVVWLKDGDVVTPNQHDIAIVDHSHLRISGVLPVDAGMFQCVASSAAGQAQQAVRLRVPASDTETPLRNTSHTINAKSFFNSLKPTADDDLYTYDNLDSTLYPDTEDSDSGEIAYAYTPNTESYYDDSAKGFDDLFHAAQGVDLDALRSRNTSMVPAPRGLRAVIVKHRFVTLSWEPPQIPLDNITGYALVYRVKGSDRERVVTGGGQKHELNVPSLQPNTTYVFTVLALTETGVSPSTATIEARTSPELGLRPPPTDLRAEPLSPHSLRVRWAAPSAGAGGAGAGAGGAGAAPQVYRVHYAVAESDNSREQYQWVTNGETSAVITGLRADTLYTVRVCAGGEAGSGAGAGSGEGVDAEGEGVSEELRVRTPSDVPAAPPGNVTAAATGATSIMVRWEAPPVRTHRGQLTGYKLRYRVVGGAGGGAGGGSGGGGGAGKRKAESLTTAADARRAELRKLEKATTYQIRVCALNANGSGPFSEWVSVSTQAQELQETSVPPQPPPLRTRSGRDWISVWWSAGGGGAGGVGEGTRVRGWALGWGVGVPDEHARNLPAQAHSHVIKDLQANAEYVISLRASNNLGLGPPVYATVRTALPVGAGADGEGEDGDGEGEDGEDMEPDEEDELPPLIPPLGLKVIMLSGTTAVVYWTDPTLPKGQTATDGRRYVVRWAVSGAGGGGGGGGGGGAGGAGGGRVRTYNATDLNCMLDDLRPFTQYDFAVKLIKGGRESPWSMLVSNTSLEAPPGGPPRELRAGAARGAAVDLAWAPPATPNGIITGYIIMYSPVGGAGADGGGGGAGADPEWSASTVGGDRRAARVERLRPTTHYQFKVQARNSAGLGPFSAVVTITTADDTNAGSALSGATSAWLWASAGGACCVLALAAALALSLCCRRPAPRRDPDRHVCSTYQKSSASAGIKPPDLWIHHDQMELKHLDKSLHSSASKISAGSVEGNALISSTLTLRAPPAPPAEYEPARHVPPGGGGGGGGAGGGGGGGGYHHHPPASLDRRHYVPTYVDSRWSSSYGAGGGGGSVGVGGGGSVGVGGSGGGSVGGGGEGGYESDDTAMLRADSSNSSHRRYDYSPMSGVGVGCAATCDRRHPRPHNMHEQREPLLSGSGMGSMGGMTGGMGGGMGGMGGGMGGMLGVMGGMLSPQSSLASLAPLQPPPAPCGSGTCPLGSACTAPGGAGAGAGAGGAQGGAGAGGVPGGGGDIYACAARERGQYVAYEPLGHYTHRDSISECSGSGGGGGGGGGAGGAGGSLQRGAGGGGHAFSHTLDGSGSVRETSPYKKSANSSPGHLPNRLQLGGAVPSRATELEPLTPSRSTERLQREMQNLEGLMKDLSAITQQQFHC